MCTAEKPFRAAGTGLGKESLSTKLVPGKVAGSMHSNVSPTKVDITASSQAQQIGPIDPLDLANKVQCCKYAVLGPNEHLITAVFCGDGQQDLAYIPRGYCIVQYICH